MEPPVNSNRLQIVRIKKNSLFPLLLFFLIQGCFNQTADFIKGIFNIPGKPGVATSSDRWVNQVLFLKIIEEQKTDLEGRMESPSRDNFLYAFCNQETRKEIDPNYSLERTNCFYVKHNQVSELIPELVPVSWESFDQCKYSETVTDSEGDRVEITAFRQGCVDALLEPGTEVLKKLSAEEQKKVIHRFCLANSGSNDCILNIVHRQTTDILDREVENCIKDKTYPSACLVLAARNISKFPFYPDLKECLALRSYVSQWDTAQKYSEEDCWVQGTFLTTAIFCARAWDDRQFECIESNAGL